MAASLQHACAESALQAFAQMSVGALAADERGAIYLINWLAEAMLGDGLKVASERLRALDPPANAELEALILRFTGPSRLSASHSGRSTVLIPRPSGKRPFIISACPLGHEAAPIFGGANAIIVVVDPEEKLVPPAEILQSHFKLTLVERRIAEQLAKGQALNEIADLLGITEETARTYLKSVFHKTDTHRQGELVSLLASFAQVPRMRTKIR